ncbi:MAG: VOC family protein [Oscillospiraceae bacterium]|jgi:hypothetical protein|nr:VOC family protein [Oscillospiraceae bacterium]
MEIPKSLLGEYEIGQIGYLVPNLEEGVKKLETFLGKKCDNINQSLEYERSLCTYKGERCDAKATCAFFNFANGMSLELIEPDGKPSIWTDDLPLYEGRVHHIAFFVTGTDELIPKLEAEGFKLIQRGKYVGGQYSFFEADGVLKARLELLENFPT